MQKKKSKFLNFLLFLKFDLIVGNLSALKGSFEMSRIFGNFLTEVMI